MLSSVLRSEEAIAVNIMIMLVFRRLDSLESKLAPPPLQRKKFHSREDGKRSTPAAPALGWRFAKIFSACARTSAARSCSTGNA